MYEVWTLHLIFHNSLYVRDCSHYTLKIYHLNILNIPVSVLVSLLVLQLLHKVQRHTSWVHW